MMDMRNTEIPTLVLTLLHFKLHDLENTGKDAVRCVQKKLLLLIATVERSIEEDPNVSIRHRAQVLDPYPSTLWKILRKDLDLRAYKIQLVQEIEVKRSSSKA
ncbi:hypothetical protein TNCV_2275241 [Trichonephila clavipes]|nr:hypothetical protein TNCV_2275241 [Trichonephila clavipes]